MLGNLGVHVDVPDPAKFRNPNGVYMKLCNLLRLDPTNEGIGLDAGSKEDENVWNEFAGNRARLREVAGAIRVAIGQEPRERVFDDNEDAPEGRLLLRLHKTRERNQSLVREKKRRALNRFGCLMCEVCGFDFKRRYGSIGEGFMEAHHVVPLSQLRPRQRTRLSDIALVCSNCHRMLHRGGLSIEVLSRVIRPRSRAQGLV